MERIEYTFRKNDTAFLTALLYMFQPLNFIKRLFCIFIKHYLTFIHIKQCFYSVTTFCRMIFRCTQSHQFFSETFLFLSKLLYLVFKIFIFSLFSLKLKIYVAFLFYLLCQCTIVFQKLLHTFPHFFVIVF